MGVRLRRSIIIGLGGTGVRTLVHIKREFLRNFGRVPSFIQLLGLDTDRASKETLPLDGKTVALADPEFMYLQALNLRKLIERIPEIEAWAPIDRMSMADIFEGAGARRPSGRVALFHNAREIYDKLKRAHDHVRSFAAGEREAEFAISDDPLVHVFIVSSLAGGTGSGMLLDIAHFCRDILEERGDRIHGFLVLAGPYLNFPAVNFAEANTYAALKELDYWMEKEDPEEVTYPGGLTITWGGEDNRAFNYIYLIDNENEENLKINELDKVLNFIARCIFLDMTVESGEGIQGGGIGPVWTNLSSFLDVAELWNDVRPKYIGLGMANLEIPVERTITLTVDSTALDLVENMLASDLEVPPQGTIPSEIADFVSSQGLDSERLIDSIIPADSKITVDPPPPKVWRENPGVVRKWRDDFIKKVEQEYTGMASEDREEYAKTLDSAQEAIASRTMALLKGEMAVGTTEAFLIQLMNYLRDKQRELEEENALYRRKRQGFLYPEKELEDAYTRGGMTPRRIRVQNVIARFNEAMQEEAALVREIWRRNAGINILGALRGYTQAYLNRVTDLKKLLTKVAHLARVDFEEKRTAPGLEDEFTTTLGEEFLSKDIENRKRMIDMDFLAQAWQEQYRDVIARPEEQDNTLLGWNKLTAERLLEWLRQVIRQRLSPITDTTVEDVLETMARTDRETGEAKVIEVAQDFVKRAIPFWKITRESGRQINELFIFGLPDRPKGIEASFFKRDLIEQNKIELGGVTGPGSCYFAITWEKYRLRALKVKMPVPLYALDKVAAYRKRYLALEENPRGKFTAHIHKDWVGGAGLPEIIPE